MTSDPRVQKALRAYDARFAKRLVTDDDDTVTDLFMSVAKAHVKKALGKDIHATEGVPHDVAVRDPERSDDQSELH